MVTALQLTSELQWNAEFVAPAHEAFNARLRAFYDKGPAEIGSKGDYNHLRGRHRSRIWDLTSAFCTDRTYATQDARDKAGNGAWLRASDVGIQGPVMWAACRRLAAAVRAGRLPAVAEWFGTFDGISVVGWYEGWASTSDSSHLRHLHVGLWTQYCNDEAQLKLLGDIITGEDDSMTPEQSKLLADIAWSVARGAPKDDGSGNEALTFWAGGVDATLKAHGEVLARIEALLAGIPSIAGVTLEDIDARIAATTLTPPAV